MQRIKDCYLETIQKIISLTGKRILEIGCGNGTRTVQIAEYCSEVVAIDPNIEAIEDAKNNRMRKNIFYSVGIADQLTFQPHSFDIVFFTLSFHHVPIERMPVAIEEAVRTAKSNGCLIFFEPAFTGSFFEAEICFDACDGDERKEKAMAYAAMLSSQKLREIAELTDETVFTFDGVDDFIGNLHPKKSSEDEIAGYLKKHNFILKADRRINIFQPRSSS